MGALPNIRIARLNSHDTHSDSVVIIDILFSYYYFNYFRHFAMLHKFAGPLVGAPFCGTRVRRNILNMPKSASEATYNNFG